MYMTKDEYRPLTSGAILVKVVHGRIVFSEDFGENYPQGRCIVACAQVSTGLLVLVKVLASLGFRIHGVRKLLQEEHYIFSADFFNRWPLGARSLTVWWTGSSDVVMNAQTRGPSAWRYISGCFNVEKSNQHEVFFNTIDKKLIMHTVRFCGWVSSFTSALSSFLGVVVLAKDYVDDFNILIVGGSMVGFANYISCVSYRVEKSVKNLKRLWQGEFDFTARKIFLCAVGSMATLGFYYFGTSESIRLILKLFKIYDGNQDSRENLDRNFEKFINISTIVTLFPSIVSYFFSQCGELLAAPKINLTRAPSMCLRSFEENFNELVATQKLNDAMQSVEGTSFRVINFLTKKALPLFVAGEMLGNALQTFNGDNGLLIHLFVDNDTAVFNQSQKIAIGVSSTFLVVVSSMIYWKFNVVDWQDLMKSYWVRSALRVLQKAGLYDSQSPQACSELVATLRLQRPAPVSSNQGILGSLWSKVKNTCGLFRKRSGNDLEIGLLHNNSAL